MSNAAANSGPIVNPASAGLWSLIREDVRCVFDRDPAARTVFEVVTTYPGVHAVIAHRLAARLWGRGWRYLARLLSFVARFFTNIEIHPGATIGHRFFIDHGAGVVIGETSEIGNDVTLYHGVTLGGTSWSKGKRHPTVCDGVVIGGGAMILGPVTIGAGAKVGANSVVIRDVPENRTVVGIPGRVVQVPETEHLNPAGIDLNHHLIPDPVAEAIGCLLERISVLENRLGVEADGTGADDCGDCDARDMCEGDDALAARKLRAAVG